MGGIIALSQVFQSLPAHELLLDAVDLVLLEVVHLLLVAQAHLLLDDFVLERVFVLVSGDALFLI